MADETAMQAAFDEWLKYHLDRANRDLARSVSQLVGEFTKGGDAFNNSRFYALRGDLADEAFRSGIDAAFAQCNRAKSIEGFDHAELRKTTERRLTAFRDDLKKVVTFVPIGTMVGADGINGMPLPSSMIT